MSQFNFKGFDSFGENSDFLKPKPVSISQSVPSSDDLTSLFTDAKDFFMDLFKQISTGAKTSTLGASFMENASQIMGLAVLLIGMALYIQIKSVRTSDEPDRYSTAITETGDPQNLVSKKVTVELFSGMSALSGLNTLTGGGGGSGGGGGRGAAADPDSKNLNPHATPSLANRNGSTIKNISDGKINFEDIITDSISTMIPPGPSEDVLARMKDVSRKCGSTDEFCNLNQGDMQTACGNITSQNSCAQKCCCGWVKFSEGASDARESASSSGAMANAKTSALHGFGVSPDGKCVAGNSAGPELTFDKDIDYYYYMGNCMKGVCKSKGT